MRICACAHVVDLKRTPRRQRCPRMAVRKSSARSHIHVPVCTGRSLAAASLPLAQAAQRCVDSSLVWHVCVCVFVQCTGHMRCTLCGFSENEATKQSDICPLIVAQGASALSELDAEEALVLKSLAKFGAQVLRHCNSDTARTSAVRILPDDEEAARRSAEVRRVAALWAPDLMR